MTLIYLIINRNIIEPKDMILLPHDEYLLKWDKYCDEVFENIKQDWKKII